MDFLDAVIEEETQKEEEKAVEENDPMADFEKRMTAARKVLERDGRFAGLCQACFDTGKTYRREGKYWGIEVQKDGDTITFVKCAHGKDISSGYGF